MATKIALIEDNISLKRRYEQNFRYFPNIEVVMTADSGESFLNAMMVQDPSKYPQVVLLDINQLQHDLLMIHGFKSKFKDIEIIVLLLNEDKEVILKVMKAGAKGYLLKDESPLRLVTAIEEVKEGINSGVEINFHYLKNLSQESGTHAPYIHQKNSFCLSERELVVVSYLVKGKTYSEIAEIIFLSPHTVKTHIKNIYKKMNVHTRAEVVKLALEEELAVL
jgi:DNA-binding NarL/FixJ family response regulator